MYCAVSLQEKRALCPDLPSETPLVKKQLLEKHMAQFQAMLKVQPRRHTKEQIQQEHKLARLEQEKTNRDKLQELRDRSKVGSGNILLSTR